MRPVASVCASVAIVPLFLFLMLVPAAPLFADTSSVSVPVSTISQLITVNSTIDFTHILPNYEHRGVLTVSWNVPSQAIASVTATEIPVYVTIASDETGPIYFKQDGQDTKEAHVILNCIIENGGCSPQSNLTQTVEVLVAAREQVDTNATILINASLSPLWHGSAFYSDSLGDGPSSVLTTIQNTTTALMNLARGAEGIKNATEGPLNQTGAAVTSASNLVLDTFDLRAAIAQNIVSVFFLAVIIGVLGGAYFFRQKFN